MRSDIVVEDKDVAGRGDKHGPGMLKADHSKYCVNNCLIQGVTFKDSPNHNLIIYCDHTKVDHVIILAPSSSDPKGSHNMDGVDVYGQPTSITAILTR